MPEKQTFGDKMLDFICCKRKRKYPDPYQFEINCQDIPIKNKQQFQSNFVRTTKYSLLSFLPKALILQFRRLANCYFLLIAILLSIDVISPLNPFTAWAPLVIVVGISMVREGYEDYQRFKSDRYLNYKSFARVFRNGKQEKITWSQVLVGDICLVHADQIFPADLILLSSSHANGVAFIQTASLDGQKNLKPRNAFKQSLDICTQQRASRAKGQFSGNIPDKELHRFSASIKLDGKQFHPQGDKQLLYRGTKLKNTEFIYGLVIYTGKNTKIMMNSDSQSIKMSQVQVKVNYVLGIILIIQVFLCIVTAICYGVFLNQKKDQLYYVDWNDYDSAADSVLIFFTYFVLINTMIPISLVVSIQMVKLFQKYFIDNDKFMYSDWRKIGVNVKSASLNEELGQIQYVFSDKTGTLTKNLMEFKIATIGKNMYGDLALIAPKGSGERPSDDPGFRDDNLKQLLRQPRNDQKISPIVIKNGEGQEKLRLDTTRSLGHEYFTALATAHQVVAEHKNGKVNYQGPSPDEITLVQAARQMNYEFITSTQSMTKVKVLNKEQTYEVLAVFPFTSDRKRMSIVLRDKSTNLIKMYTKGADNIIKQRLAADNFLNLDEELNRFSVIGLRTLLIGMRIISDKQYAQFERALKALPAVGRQKPLEQLQSKLQKQFYLIGATAVLDRLQDQVPETIKDLLKANIKVWMLTGDKMQTAENIAKSCNLIQSHFYVLKFKPPSNMGEKTLRASNVQQIKQGHRRPGNQRQFATEQHFQEFQRRNQTLQGYLEDMVKKAQDLSKTGHSLAFLIQGADLTPILATQENQKMLATLSTYCDAFVCCRLLPIQKANVVSMVRNHLNKITLAIGDGANDVPMIKTAHIGIGLFGEQGMGAVQASDYALPEFRMLWRLLLVHGRWNYIRISEMILYFFYKNMLFTIPQFLIAFYCAYSGQTLFDDVYLTLYNLIFTALPLIVRAVLQQDINYIFKKKQKYNQFPQVSGKSMITQAGQIPEKYSINKYFYRLFPKIYFIGQQNCIFNYKNYFAWIFEGAVQSTLLTMITIYILSEASLNGDGISPDYWLVGVTIYSSVILVVTFKLATHTRFWSILLILTILITSLGLYIVYMWISNYAFSEHVVGVAYVFYTSGQIYFIVLFSVCVVLTVDGVVVFLDFRRGSYASKMREIVYQEQINNKQFYDQVSVTLSSAITTNSDVAHNDYRI